MSHFMTMYPQLWVILLTNRRTNSKHLALQR